MEENLLQKKLTLWENRLLDMSKRNRMISFKENGMQCLRFTEPGFDELFESLVVRCQELTIRRPIGRTEEQLAFSVIRLMQLLGQPLQASTGDIAASRPPEACVRITKNIKRNTDLALQEKGTNILFLSFGMLYWRDRDTKPGEWLKAPLILVPAQLEQTTLESPFRISRTGEELLVNPTFAYFLQVNFGLTVPALRDAEDLSSVDRFFNELTERIGPMGWHVEREVHLSTMSFLKTGMYNDLVDNEQRILQHPVIRAFAGERNEFTSLDEDSIDFRHDEEKSESVYEVMNADSSQKDAIELSQRGISFVMQGPPGTGKSQTIANIIAQGIADGKKILFVSEKLAALEVVYRRLCAIGIASLCLPLHDPKTNRQDVLLRLKQNLDAPHLTLSEEKLADLHRLDQIRQDLAAYDRDLHSPVAPMGLSVFEAYELLFALQEQPDLPLDLPKVLQCTHADLDRMCREAEDYAHFRLQLKDRWQTSPWLWVRRRIPTDAARRAMKRSLSDLADALAPVCRFPVEGTPLGDLLSWAGAAEAYAVGEQIAQSPELPAQQILEPSFSAVSREEKPAGRFLALLEELRACGFPAVGASPASLFRLFRRMEEAGLSPEELALTDACFTPEGLAAARLCASRRRQALQAPAPEKDPRFRRFAGMTEEEFFAEYERLTESADSEEGAEALALANDYYYLKHSPVSAPGSPEASYPEDSALLGRHYLLSQTDWALLEKNLSFASALQTDVPEAERTSWRTALAGTDGQIPERAAALLPELADLLPQFSDISELDLAAAEERLRRLQKEQEEEKECRRSAADLRERIGKAPGLPAALLRQMLEKGSESLYDLLDLLSDLRSLAPEMEAFLSLFEPEARLRELPLSALRTRLAACRDSFSEIDRMAEYQACVNSCRADGLSDFLAEACRTGKTEELGKMLEKAFLTLWIDEVTAARESLASFSALRQQHAIEDFNDLDQKQLSYARERVRRSAYERMPRRGAGRVIGEMGILLREFSKVRNPLTIRQLFDSIPHLLLRLTPCLMMSPLSVAYFLKADLYTFDMVIFDEASQIFPENAIGAILRSRQAIIAGDSRQMPPTSFFHTMVELNDEDEDPVDCSDSILEEAEAVLPNLSLTWHYRSKNEDLITFSNRNMYSGSLVTFPNAFSGRKDTGVELSYVESAVYENRQNREEALRCVALAVECFQKHPERSLGVIAFSVTQEEAIEEAFYEYRRSHPEQEKFFFAHPGEPFFIKNLENVQGDERDTILLSVGYGKNAQGILRYNFGPLGMLGGERRMNVAITRARQNIKLVCSLLPEDFDEVRIRQNAGARLLHDYISYARDGVRPEPGAEETAAGRDFCAILSACLEAEGFHTVRNVGSSAFRVELAVEDPLSPGSYIAGIETDGYAAHRSRTVRDRESLRPDVLKAMGWKMLRIWSTQWYRDPAGEKERLLAFVRACACEASEKNSKERAAETCSQ